MRASKSIFHNIDWLLVGLFLLLVFVGWGNIYAAVFNEAHGSVFDLTQEYGKQLLWIGTSLILALFILAIDGKFYSTFSFIIYGLSMVSLLTVALVGSEIAGARSWFKLGEFSLQPAEFAKIATALALAAYLSKGNNSLQTLKQQSKAFLFFLFPMALIMLQPDAGSAMVYAAFVFVLYREGLPTHYLIIGFGTALLFLLTLLINDLVLIGILAGLFTLLAYFFRRNKKLVLSTLLAFLVSAGFTKCVDFLYKNVLHHHHRNRIEVLLGQKVDPYGVGYNTEQALIAIGSGGFAGKGYLEGTQTKFDFVPEQSTDFIFCTVGEEWGFLGSIIVLGLFLMLILRIIDLAERQRDTFSRIYGYSVAAILFIHVAINVAMALGFAPVIGIPLPFFSYGGSSLWGFTILLFIFIKLDAYRMDILG